jgi:hypothetical protein
MVRVKVPSGVKLMPHKHPEDRIYTVISGVFYVGLGTRFEAEDLKAYPPGSVVVLPGDTWHFHWAKLGEYVTQVTAIGPLGLEYKETQDDPRNAARSHSSVTPNRAADGIAVRMENGRSYQRFSAHRGAALRKCADAAGREDVGSARSRAANETGAQSRLRSRCSTDKISTGRQLAVEGMAESRKAS